MKYNRKELIEKGQDINLFGVLSDIDILDAMYNNHLAILPFNASNLTGLGYNLTPSDFILSTQKGVPEKIYAKGGERFALISPHDTVLILTNEYVRVSDKIAGTFHSRVKVVSQGFSHISTTIDPCWHGPLLIAMTNPSSKSKKFIIQSVTNHKPIPFVTLMLHFLSTNSQNMHDNPAFRSDILDEYAARPSKFGEIFLSKAYEPFFNILDIIHKSSPEINIGDEEIQFLDIIRSVLTDILCDINNSEQMQKHSNRLLAHIHANNNESIKYGILFEHIIKITDYIKSNKGQVYLKKEIEITLRRSEIDKQGAIWQNRLNEINREVKKYPDRSRWLRLILFIKNNWLSFVFLILPLFLFAKFIETFVKSILINQKYNNLWDAVYIIYKALDANSIGLIVPVIALVFTCLFSLISLKQRG